MGGHRSTRFALEMMQLLSRADEASSKMKEGVGGEVWSELVCCVREGKWQLASSDKRLPCNC